MASGAILLNICPPVVPSALMVYDYLISIDREVLVSRSILSSTTPDNTPKVEYIWKRPRTTTTILYLIVRYFGTVYGLINTTGQVFLGVQGWPSCGVMWLVQAILQLRLYVLYDRSRRVLLFMGFVYVAEILAMAVILVTANLTSGSTNEPIPGLKLCTNTGLSNSFYIFWLPVLSFECILCSLAVWAGVRRSRNDTSPISVSNKIRLLDVLIKGNVGYFLVIFLVSVVTAVMWGTLSEEWIEVPEGFPHAGTVIAGCRLILHIRDATTPVPEDTFLESLAFEYPMQPISVTSA
ncbi:hypothetical protein PISMIDRAFT_8737 [Pisolithus microcarpus 441]|uniref:DUF6533 domain-containing protein n=1 Tax=Pisolithus microcarpus 441 TaxID=765257 RepID=A0A0C9YNS2_9AGAM|nr:hypothetical protein PISMIDRAFT_8737 [Pisolithus microcarpus 441]